MANVLQLISGLAQARSISSAIDTLLGASDEAAARAAINAAIDEPPYYVGQETSNSLPLSLTGGLWADDRGWQWIPPTGQSIGSASSGATVANADLEQLYLALWPHLGLSTPGYSIAGGVGASAAADWAANKALTIPDYRGRARLQIGQGSGISNRTLGQILGEEGVTLAEDEMPNHNHGLGRVQGSYGTGTSGIVFGGGSNLDTNSAGSGNAHNNMQPSTAVNILWFIGVRA